MSPEEYMEAALRTVPEYLQFWTYRSVPDDLRGTSSYDKELEANKQLLANATLGLAGEAREILEDPSSDECGDGWWYVFVTCKALNISPQEMLDSSKVEPLWAGNSRISLLMAATRMCELTKKIVYHNKPYLLLKEEFVLMLQTYAAELSCIDSQYREQTWQQNANKLAARHGDSFKDFKELVND